MSRKSLHPTTPFRTGGVLDNHLFSSNEKTCFLIRIDRSCTANTTWTAFFHVHVLEVRAVAAGVGAAHGLWVSEYRAKVRFNCMRLDRCNEAETRNKALASDGRSADARKGTGNARAGVPLLSKL